MENFPNYAGYGQSPTVCANHPDRVSYTQCGRCGRIICGECQTAQDAGIVCPDCYRELTGGSSKGLESTGLEGARLVPGSTLAHYVHAHSDERRDVRSATNHSQRMGG